MLNHQDKTSIWVWIFPLWPLKEEHCLCAGEHQPSRQPQRHVRRLAVQFGDVCYAGRRGLLVWTTQDHPLSVLRQHCTCMSETCSSALLFLHFWFVLSFRCSFVFVWLALNLLFYIVLPHCESKVSAYVILTFGFWGFSTMSLDFWLFFNSRASVLSVFLLSWVSVISFVAFCLHSSGIFLWAKFISKQPNSSAWELWCPGRQTSQSIFFFHLKFFILCNRSEILLAHVSGVLWKTVFPFLWSFPVTMGTFSDYTPAFLSLWVHRLFFKNIQSGCRNLSPCLGVPQTRPGYHCSTWLASFSQRLGAPDWAEIWSSTPWFLFQENLLNYHLTFFTCL